MKINKFFSVYRFSALKREQNLPEDVILVKQH